jgi:predicted DNA-binding transcriptional regulator AlpA
LAKGKDRTIEPRGLSREDAAAYMGIGATLFDRLIAAGRVPRPVRLDGRVIWDRRKLDRFLDDLFDQPEFEDPHSRAV